MNPPTPGPTTLHLPLDPASPLPLYHQLVQGLRAAIAAGALPPDSELPGARELAAQVRVNYHTVGKAYSELESQGLLERRRGGPYRVVAIPPGILARQELIRNLDALAQETVRQGIPTAEAQRYWEDALSRTSSGPSNPTAPATLTAQSKPDPEAP